MLETIASNKLATMQYNAATQVLVAEYHGIANFEMAMEAFVKVNEFSCTRTIAGMIADVRNLRGSFMRVMDYFKADGYPLLIENGLKAEALIIPNDIIITNLSEQLREMLIGLGMQCELFSTMEPAETWLTQVLERKEE